MLAAELEQVENRAWTIFMSFFLTWRLSTLTMLEFVTGISTCVFTGQGVIKIKIKPRKSWLILAKKTFVKF